MVVRERFWHGVVVVAALVALVIGTVGIVSHSAQSFPAMAQAAVPELADSPDDDELDSQVESADEALRYSSKHSLCFWMIDPITEASSLICVPRV